jgi:cyanophycin synthetase
MVKDKSKIIFTDFDLTEGFIGFYFKVTDLENEEDYDGNVYFELSPKILPSSDLIALALSTLCGTKYSNVHIDLNISPSILNSISKFTLANVTAKSNFDNFKPNEQLNKITLNFSGGFDSLAAKCIMPDDTSLVSMDFGGNFSRERTFFGNFSPCIVKTNLLSTLLRYNSWTFMGIASILFSEYLGTNYQTFGNILEASLDNFSSKLYNVRHFSAPPFIAAGIESAPYVLGLTEVGTIKLIAHYHPELIDKSLISLANPGEEKRCRKQFLAKIVTQKLRMALNLDMVDCPSKILFKFGQNFAGDFLSFYIVKNAGMDIASQALNDIPKEVEATVETLRLDFYERYNTNFIINFPQTLKSDMLSKLTEAGIEAYTEADWKEFKIIRQFLSQYHEIK